MSDPEVEQLTVLSKIFAEVLAENTPESVAILGIAGGNGLEHIDSSVTKRVVGVDVNADYLNTVRDRHSHTPGLELHCMDLAERESTEKAIDPAALVHAALIFEHAGIDPCLENAVNFVAPEGTMSVVLQLPTLTSQGVAATSFISMQLLKDDFALIDPNFFGQRMSIHGFHLQRESQRDIPGGKGLWLGTFRR